MMSHLTPMLRIFAHEISPSSQLSKGEVVIAYLHTHTRSNTHIHIHTHTHTHTHTDLQQQLVGLVCALNAECSTEVQNSSRELTQSELQILTSAINM